MIYIYIHRHDWVILFGWWKRFQHHGAMGYTINTIDPATVSSVRRPMIAGLAQRSFKVRGAPGRREICGKWD